MVLFEKWDEIIDVINEEIPSSNEIEALLSSLDAPRTSADFGISEDDLKKTFEATKDIRDKYVVSRLCFDLGIIDEVI